MESSTGLAAYGEAMKAIVSLLKQHAPDSKMSNKIRASIKNSLRRSAAESMAAFGDYVRSLPGHAEALESGDHAFFVAKLSELLRIEASRLYLKLPPECTCALFDQFVRAYRAASSESSEPRDDKWSTIASMLLGKTVDISSASGERLDSLVSLAERVVNDLTDAPEASASDLDGVDVSMIQKNPEPGPYDAVLKEILDRLPKNVDASGMIEAIPDQLRSEGARKYVSTLHKIFKRINPTLIESLLSKVLSRIDTSSLSSLASSLSDLDLDVISQEAGSIVRSIRQAEVIESLRHLISEVDPGILKSSIKAALTNSNVSRESVSDMVQKIVKSNAFPGLAARIPDIFGKDGSIDVDALVQAITRSNRTPAPPRLSVRRR